MMIRSFVSGGVNSGSGGKFGRGISDSFGLGGGLDDRSFVANGFGGDRLLNGPPGALISSSSSHEAGWGAAGQQQPRHDGGSDASAGLRMDVTAAVSDAYHRAKQSSYEVDELLGEGSSSS